MQAVRVRVKLLNICYRKFDVRLDHDVQQNGIASVRRVIVWRHPCGHIVDNPPSDQIGSVDLRAEEPLVVVSVNRKVRMLQIKKIRLTVGSGRRKG